MEAVDSGVLFINPIIRVAEFENLGSPMSAGAMARSNRIRKQNSGIISSMGSS
jgi:hypothetical protein